MIRNIEGDELNSPCHHSRHGSMRQNQVNFENGHHINCDASAREIDIDLQHHIQHCTCTCNHLGYGNFLNYQTNPSSTEVQELHGSSFSIEPHECQHGPQCFNTEIERAKCNGRLSNNIMAPVHIRNNSYNNYKDFGIKIGPCIICSIILALIISSYFVVKSYFPPTPPYLLTYEERLQVVDEILKEVPLIDGHNDLAWNLKIYLRNRLTVVNFSSEINQIEPWASSVWSQTDIPRLKKGRVGAQFWSAFIPCRSNMYYAVVRLALEQIDVIRVITDFYPEVFTFADSVQGIKEAHASGKIASLIGVESGHLIDYSLEILRSYYYMGARYLTLTHTCSARWASCCFGPNEDKEYQGLTKFGKVVIEEMNRLGMIIDLSYSSVKTMEDTLNVTKAPVIFSHANAYALCNDTRNVPDHILQLLAENDGIIMVSFYSSYVSCNATASIDDLIAHINYIREIAGEDHIGIGSGYEGINSTVIGLEDVSHYPDLLATLMQDPKWGDIEIKKFAGLNFLRVFEKVEQVRDELKKTLKPITIRSDDFEEYPPAPPQCKKRTKEETVRCLLDYV